MAPPQRVKAAFKAMKDIGVPEEKTKPALKKLLNLFDKNWDLIEEENYRVLADTIFEYEDTEAAEKEKKKAPGNVDQGEFDEEATQAKDETERPLKRLRLKHQNQAAPSQDQHSLSSASVALKIPKPEPGEPEASPSQPLTGSPQPLVRKKGKQPISPQISQKDRRPPHERSSQALQIKEPKVQPGVMPKQKLLNVNNLIKPKDEPFTDDMLSLEPLAVILPDHMHPEVPSNSRNPVGSQAEHMHQEVRYNSGNPVCSHDGQGSGAPKSVDCIDKGLGTLASSSAEGNHIQEADGSKKMPVNIDIAASFLGEVKLFLSCNPGQEGKDFCFPDLQAVLEAVDDICLKKYKIMNPEFSIMNVMEEFCEYVVKLSTNADSLSQDRSNQHDAGVIDSNGIHSQSNGSYNAEFSDNVAATADTI